MDRRAPPRWVLVAIPAASPPCRAEAHHALQQRYRVRFDGCGPAWYRDGLGATALHSTAIVTFCWPDDTVIALVTLGQRRPWYPAPAPPTHDDDTPNKGASHDLSPGPGDLIVMAGRTQTAWEHSVPKTDPRVGGRISPAVALDVAPRTLRPSAGAIASPFISVADGTRPERRVALHVSVVRSTRPLPWQRGPDLLGAIENTSFGVPAAAHTTSLSRNAGSRNTRSSVAWPNGGTPPIGKPVAARAESASTRWVLDPPAARARASVAHCRSPGTRASTISSLPSGWITPNTSDFTIWPTWTPIAAAASVGRAGGLLEMDDLDRDSEAFGGLGDPGGVRAARWGSYAERRRCPFRQSCLDSAQSAVCAAPA